MVALENIYDAGEKQRAKRRTSGQVAIVRKTKIIFSEPLSRKNIAAVKEQVEIRRALLFACCCISFAPYVKYLTFIQALDTSDSVLLLYYFPLFVTWKPPNSGTIRAPSGILVLPRVHRLILPLS